MLFADVKFHLTACFPPPRADALLKYLKANGAEKVPIEEASHIIADSIRFEGRANAKEDAAIVSVGGQPGLQAKSRTDKGD